MVACLWTLKATKELVRIEGQMGKKISLQLGRQCGVVGKALEYESGDLGTIFGSATELLCDHHFPTPCLSFPPAFCLVRF